VSGMTAAIYLKLAGADVRVYERAANVGGVSAGWDRKGFHFEGGIHWMIGTNPKRVLHDVWREIGALTDDNPVIFRDPMYTLITDHGEICLYRNIDKMMAEFRRVAPEDERAIARLERDVRTFMAFNNMIKTPRGLRTKSPVGTTQEQRKAMLPGLLKVPRLAWQSVRDYLSDIKNEDLKNLLLSVICPEHNALAFCYVLGAFADGDGGYPRGGASKVGENLKHRFLELGGELMLHMPVERVAVVDGQARGVLVNGKVDEADEVLITIDTRRAIDTLFERPLHEKWTPALKHGIPTEQVMMLSIGVKTDLNHYPGSMRWVLDEPIVAGGVEYKILPVDNYSQITEYSPEGCSSMTVMMIGNTYAYWKAAKEDGSYVEKKCEVIEQVVGRLEKLMPEIVGKVVVTDLATPMTFVRYCDTYEGSFMSIWKRRSMPNHVPVRAESVEHLYFAGQRTMLNGGLPVAAMTGRRAAQEICMTHDLMWCDRLY